VRRAAWWVMVVAGVLVGIAVVLAVAVYLIGERRIARVYEVPLEEIAVPTGEAQIAEGERLATIRGCNGCHRADLSGRVFVDIPNTARLVAANLTGVAPTYSDRELARLIRHGVKRDGTGVYGMPSEAFYDLTDEDCGAIIAYLRSAPRAERALPSTELRILGRLGLLLGELQSGPDLIDHTRARIPAAKDDPERFGRYLAATICTECHGPDLGGHGRDTPDLVIASAYSEAQFRHLLRTGVALGGRPLGLMAEVARERFTHLRDDEVHALHQYLTARAKLRAQVATRAE
jgi:mono/diheme cytochrome c family protein